MNSFVDCHCGAGSLLPLSDYGPDGSAVTYKVWACSDPKCSYVIRIDKGAVTKGDVGARPEPKHDGVKAWRGRV